MKIVICNHFILIQPQQEDPQDQEISYEEPTSVSGAPVDTLSQNFYRTQARVPVLCLEKLRIGSDCISSLNGRIDLKKLQKASPGLFPKVIKLTGTKGVSSKGNNANNAKGKKENSAAASPVKKKEKKETKKKEFQVKINSDSSDDSDSDLEELRKKIMKPSLFKDTNSSASGIYR